LTACILIPAYNAEKTIRSVIIESLAHRLPVAVVDDGSTDGTKAELSGLPVTILEHYENLGKGAALKTAFRWALESGFDDIVTIDADGQHDISAIPLLLSEAEREKVDLLIAARDSQFRQMSFLRSFWNRVGAWFIKKGTGFGITDSQSGFRYYSAALLENLSMESDGYALEMEIIVKGWKKGFRVASVPIAARVPDGRGTSHFRPFRDTLDICFAFLRHRYSCRGKSEN